MTASRRGLGLVGYLTTTRRPPHALAAVAPLVMLHAALVGLFRPPVIASAASWVNAPLLALGLSPWQAALALAGVFVVAAAVFALRDRSFRQVPFRPLLIPLIWIEGCAWGLLLHLWWNRPFQGDAPSQRLPGLGPGDELTLALGAGIYEEIVFRVGFFALALVALRLAFRDGSRRRDASSSGRDTGLRVLAVLVTSVAFALAHHLGGESPTWAALAFRTLAAVYLTALYAWRGLGIAVMAHASYDAFVAFY